MSFLERLAKLVIMLPIGFKYKASDGTYKKIKPDKTDNFMDVTADLVTTAGAKDMIASSIKTIDTTDKINDATVVAKIDSLTATLTAA